MEGGSATAHARKWRRSGYPDSDSDYADSDSAYADSGPDYADSGPGHAEGTDRHRGGQNGWGATTDASRDYAGDAGQDYPGGAGQDLSRDTGRERSTDARRGDAAGLDQLWGMGRRGGTPDTGRGSAGDPGPGGIDDILGPPAPGGDRGGAGPRQDDTGAGQLPDVRTETIAAELAGWAAGELPGQASARLAAWAAIGGVPAAGYRRAGAPDLGGAGVGATERVR